MRASNGNKYEDARMGTRYLSTSVMINEKTLFCSDLHLSKFDQKKFNYLLNLFESYDRVVIVGDLWDSWFITFEDFLNSGWNGLFPLLKARKCIYLFGNHDPGELVDSKVDQFAESVSKTAALDLEGFRIHLSHGDKYVKPDERYYVKLYFNGLNLIKKYRISRLVFFWFLSMVEKLLSFIIPSLLFNSEIARSKNEFIKRARLIDFKGGLYFCGETHYAELDLENGFGNCGAIIQGYASYLTFENGEFELIREHY